MFRELSEFPEDEQFPGVAVIRLEGGLFFATSDALDERVRQVIQQTPDVTCVVLDCSAINFVDSQGVAELAEIVTITEEEQVTLRLARLKPGGQRHVGPRRHPRDHHRGQDPRQRGRGRPGTPRSTVTTRLGR